MVGPSASSEARLSWIDSPGGGSVACQSGFSSSPTAVVSLVTSDPSAFMTNSSSLLSAVEVKTILSPLGEALGSSPPPEKSLVRFAYAVPSADTSRYH